MAFSHIPRLTHPARNDRKGPPVADDTVQIRYEPTREVREIHRDAIPFFTNQEGWVVLKSDGSVNPKPAAHGTNADKKD